MIVTAPAHIRIHRLPSMDDWITAFFGHGKTAWATAVTLFGAGWMLPDPMSVLSFCGSAGVGAGLLVGGFYVTFKRQMTAAQIEAQKAWDTANRASLTVQVQEQLERHAILAARIADLEVTVQANRQENESLREDLVAMAKLVLAHRGVIR